MDFVTTPKPWTTEELARLYQGRLNHIPYRVLSKQIKRPAAECQRKWNDGTDWQTKLGFVDANETARRKGDRDALIKRLSDGVDSKLELNRIRTDALTDRLATAITPFAKAPMPKIYTPRRRDKSQNSDEDAGLMLSDLHIGQKYTMEETGGLGEYSLAKFDERLNNLRLGVRDIIELHTQLYRIPKLNLFLLGDNTHGMAGVGQWSAAYTDLSIIDQVAAGVKSLADTIYYFLGMFEEIHVWCTGGNHGRAAQKGVEKDYVNWDYVLYKMLELWFKDNPRVKFYAPKTWYIFTTIRNHKFLMLHGEDVKGGNFPIQSLARVEQKLAGILKDHPDYTMIGHFHSAAELTTNHGELFINGSFLGPDMHSLKAIQAGGKPTQKLFGIHDKHGVTWRYNLSLDHPREE